MEEQRRQFLKKSGAAVIGLAALATVRETKAANEGNQWIMIIDLNRCTGCQSCVIACKAHNRTAEGLFRTRVQRDEAAKDTNARAVYTSTLCNHCEEPVCVEACSDGAIRHGSDGIVRVDREKCSGAGHCASKGRCVKACDRNGGALNSEDGNRFEKCDLCSVRLSRGLLPVCVENCSSGARIFGDEKNPSPELAAYLRREDLVIPGGVRGRIRYVELKGEKGGLRI